MSRASWRWGVVAVLVTALCAAPSLAGALPSDAAPAAPAELVRRIHAAGTVGWSGYAESRGRLGLPDVDELSGLPALLGGTTRLRAWWRSPQDWRVDTLALTGETDTIHDEDGSWVFESANERATRIYGDLDVWLPTPPDLLPPTLGARLAGSQDVRASALPDRRVAGRAAAGVRLTPRSSAATTIAHVDLWADPRTGLPLRVEVTAVGARTPAFVSTMLDLELRRPASARTAFTPPPYTDVRVTEAPDLVARIDRFAPYRLPDRLVGVARSDWLRAMRPGGGIATYGRGLTSFGVLPLRRGDAGRIIDALSPNGDGTRGVASTPLVNAVVTIEGDRAYLVAGTVPVALIDRVLAALRADPPTDVRR